MHWLWHIIVGFFAGNHASVDVLSGDAESKSTTSPRFVESEEPDTLPKRQFKTAEIADAVMGTEVPISPSQLESLFPKNGKDPLSGFTPPCDESSDQCAQPAASADEDSPEEMSLESSQQVTNQELCYMIIILAVTNIFTFKI